MSENKEYVSRSDELGNIHISEEVLAAITAAAALDVEGSAVWPPIWAVISPSYWAKETWLRACMSGWRTIKWKWSCPS